MRPPGTSVTDATAGGPHRFLRRAFPWFVAAILLTTLGLPVVQGLSEIPVASAIGYAHPVPANETVLMNLTDQPAYSPQFVAVPSNSTLDLHLHNLGAYPHTFTLSNTSGTSARLASNATPSEVYAFFHTNGMQTNVSLAPGASAWANLSFNASTAYDSFEFASVVPYQFQAGMWGLLNITSTGPGLAVEENTTDAPGFQPSVLSASPAHYPAAIDVLVTNLGNLGHTFTVVPQSNVTLTVGNYSSYFTAHAPLVSATIPSGAGSSAWANFTIPAAGVYMYLCLVTGHFASGMDGNLYVGVPVPPPPASPSTAIVDTWILTGSAVLFGIGLVLAALASYSGRFPKAPSSHGRDH
jgi:uncharacterized cupredoxin-like copper-binding protein